MFGGVGGRAFWADVVRVVGVEGQNGLFRLSMSIYSKSRRTLVMLDWEGSAGGVGRNHVTLIIAASNTTHLR